MVGFAVVCRLPVQDEAVGFDSSEVDMRVLGDLATEKADEFVKRLVDNEVGTVCEPARGQHVFWDRRNDDVWDKEQRRSGQDHEGKGRRSETPRKREGGFKGTEESDQTRAAPTHKVLKVVLKSRYALFSNMSRRMAARDGGEGALGLAKPRLLPAAAADAQKA
jgi:hypothetical protein